MNNRICVVIEFSGLNESEVQEFLSEKFAVMQKGGATISCLSAEGYKKVKEIVEENDE